ncbi:NOP12 [Candida pseudojiufengensis]|uniref:NOP12 n=1 Tax=Candida pseudojiufengensis TaxID=497109 RepID=UPI002224385A|nr:NOP12 [Candida pseudojiufengensis]KAI5960545.1 NOP12 [Candida pseudojiufengensis]
MSSFSSLFGDSSKRYDQSLDKIFSTKNDGPISNDQLLSKKRTIINVPEVKNKKRKLQKSKEEEEDEVEEEEQEIEDKSENEETEDVSDDSEDQEIENKSENEESEDVSEDEEDEEDEDEETESKPTTKKQKKKDENFDLEAKYFQKNFKDDTEPVLINETSNDEEDTKNKSTKSAKSATTIDFKESEMEKAERTIFIGNVPSDVVTSKSKTKEFKKLFKQYGNIESIRFRSISFEENLPRKISFAKKNLHKSRDSVNAYIVFEDKSASLLASKNLNGTVFENHHLRVDHIAHPASKDNKRTIFVGNLDFEEQEENLWKYFNLKLDNDVESVRIIRDSKTNMGKGFALVQFKDSLSVNKALLLNDKPMNIVSGNKKGRTLRISRAKANAKPSLLSPNHFENVKKSYASNKSKEKNLTDSQKTKIGRAQNILGKADRSSIGKVKRDSNKFIEEGQRATKGSRIVGIKGLKTGKVKKPRIRDRSTKFKDERNSMQKELKR